MYDKTTKKIEPHTTQKQQKNFFRMVTILAYHPINKTSISILFSETTYFLRQAAFPPQHRHHQSPIYIKKWGKTISNYIKYYCFSNIIIIAVLECRRRVHLHMIATYK